MNNDFFSSEELRQQGYGSVGENVFVGKNCHIVNCENIYLDSDIKINPFCTLVAYKDSKITIGRSVHIGSYSLLYGMMPISIGSFVAISSAVKIFTASEDFSENSLLGYQIPSDLRKIHMSPILISDHCGIGANSILLPHSNMAKGGVLAANSLLKKSIQNEFEIFGGNPAKKIGSRKKIALEYAEEYLKRTTY